MQRSFPFLALTTYLGYEAFTAKPDDEGSGVTHCIRASVFTCH